MTANGEVDLSNSHCVHYLQFSLWMVPGLFLQVTSEDSPMKTFITAAQLMLISATSVRAQEKEKTDADSTFLTKVIPGIAASIKIIKYAEKNTSDEKVKDFAERVAKQHKGG